MAQRTDSALPHADSPDEWITIVDRELENISGSLKGKVSNDNVIQCALLATEAVLKAIIWKRERWSKWPGKTKHTRYLYYHELDIMLEKSGAKVSLLSDPGRLASWDTLVNANAKQARYSPTPTRNAEAWAVAKSARDLDKGVVPWLKQHYENLT